MELQLYKKIGHPKFLHKLAKLKILEHYLEENVVEVFIFTRKGLQQKFFFQISEIYWAAVSENPISQTLR